MDELKEKELFFEALDTDSLTLMHKVSKSDLHNHVGRGGSQDYLATNKGITIAPNSTPLN
jgi:hypothetical protein